MKIFKKVLSALVSGAMLFSSAIGIRASAEVESIKLMCFGDSITDGYNYVGGYRYTLGNLLSANGYSSYVDFVGPNWGGNQYDPQHAGYSGYTIAKTPKRSGLTDFTEWIMGEYTPDVVMLQIGTNDILDYYELDTIGDRLETLVDMVLEQLPEDGMLFLATITVMDATNGLYIDQNYYTVELMDKTVDSYNEQIRAIVAEKQSAGENIALCDWDGIITKSDLYDGVHPTESGYGKMGAHWYEILSQYLETGSSGDVGNTGEDILYGDVNADGVVDAIDATLAVRFAVGSATFDDSQISAADVNGDGVVDAIDGTLITRYAVGILEGFPIEGVV